MGAKEIADTLFSVRPDATSFTKAFNQPPIVRCEYPEAMRADVFSHHVGVDFC